MSKDQTFAIKDAVHKMQLSLLEGIKDQKQLFAAGSLMSCLDYEDVVTERTIANLCGYPLCKNALPSTPLRRGRYHISLKEHKVFDLQETSKFCSSDCLINSGAFMGTLQEDRCSDLNLVKLNGILSLFHDLSVFDSFGVNGDLGLSRLKTHENEELKGGEVSLEEWMGPSDAIEGYVPKNISKPKPSRSKNCEQGSSATHDKPNSKKGLISSEMDFISTIITNDEYSVSKSPLSHATEATVHIKSEEPKGKGGSKNLEQKAAESGSSSVSLKNHFSSVASCDRPSSEKNLLFNEMDFISSVVTRDEYSVSKLPLCSAKFTFNEKSVKTSAKSSKDLEQQAVVSGSSSSIPRNKALNKKSEDSEEKVKIFEEDKSIAQEVFPSPFIDGATTDIVESSKECHTEKACLLSGIILKPSLKSSHAKKLSRSVTWADENAASCGDSNLCEVKVIEDAKTGPEAFPGFIKYDDDNALRFASAEACAMALSEAAEAVASRDLDVSDAVSEAGIIVLPGPRQVNEEVSVEDVDEETFESEPTLLKWPKKPGLPDSDIFYPDQSWFDELPEGFSLTLSNFAAMWNSLFGWVTSCSLAYVYGKDENFHEEYLYVNGREYPRKFILEDGRSSEIKDALGGCLSRALPGLITDLRLPIPKSELEKGLACLLDTMLFIEAIPALRMKQWQVIALLLIDALSVSRIPAVATYMNNGRLRLNMVLDDCGIGMEEYEVMKDILMPLGRVPCFSSQSGA